MGNVLKKAVSIFEAIEKYIMVGCMVVFAFLVVIDVVCRKFLGFSLEFMQEFGKYLMVWATFIGASLGVKNGEHPSMSLVLDSVPKPAKIVLNVVVNLISAGATGYAAYYTFKQFLLVKKMNSLTVTLWRLPVWVLYWIVPLGFVLMAIGFLYRAYYVPMTIIKGTGKEADK